MAPDEKKITWLVGFSHFITHGYMTLLPPLLVVITTEHNMSFLDIGIIANVGYFLYGLGSFPVGYLADKLGSKRVLTVGIFGMALSSLLLGFSKGIADFAIFYALLGAFASIHHPAGLSLIARRVENKKGKALGLHGVMGNVGLFLTPLFAALSIWLFESWRAAYIIYSGIGLLFAIILHKASISREEDLSFKALFRFFGLLFGYGKEEARKISEVEEKAAEGESSVLPISLLFLFAGSILSGFIFRGSLTFLPALLQQEIHFITIHDEPNVIAGYITTAILSLGLIGAWFGGYFNDKIKKPELFPIVIFVLVAPALYLMSRFSDTSLIVTGCVFSLVYYAWQPSHNYLIARYTRKSSHGMGFGMNFFLIFGIGSAATAIGGYVADDYGVDRFYMIMSIIAITALFFAVLVYKARHHLFTFTWKLLKEPK